MQRGNSPEQQYVYNHISNKQNTHKAELISSVTTFLLKLADIYQIYIPLIVNKTADKRNEDNLQAEKIPKAEILTKHTDNKITINRSQKNLAMYINGLQECIKKQDDALLHSAWHALSQTFKLPVNEYDIALTYENGKLQKYLITNETTLALVYAALTDVKKYPVYTNLEASEEEHFTRIEKDKNDRLLSLFSRIKEIESAAYICPTGRRHEFAFTLNLIYPNILSNNPQASSIVFIEDMGSHLADISREYITTILERMAVEDKDSYKTIWVNEFDYTKERSCLITNIIDQSHDQLKKIIIHSCAEHGIDANYFSSCINDHLRKINDLPLPLNNNPTLHALKYIFETKITPGILGEGLKLTKNWIETQFEFNNPYHCEQLHSFSLTHKNYSLLLKYQVLLKNWKHEIINPEQINEIKNQLEDYYRTIIKHRYPIVYSVALEKSMLILEKSCNSFTQDTRISWIENFFANFFMLEAQGLLHSRHTDDTIRILYTELFEPSMQEKIFLSDQLLEEIFSIKNGIIELSPYEINRILLHAITLHPEKWTPLFFYYFKEISHYLENTFKNQQNKENDGRNLAINNLQKHSYPSKLLKQLKFLANYYQYLENKEITPNIPQFYFTYIVPMPHFITTSMLLLIGRDFLITHINTIANFCEALDKTNESSHYNLLTILGIEFISELFEKNKPAELGLFLYKISSKSENKSALNYLLNSDFFQKTIKTFSLLQVAYEKFHPTHSAALIKHLTQDEIIDFILQGFNSYKFNINFFNPTKYDIIMKRNNAINLLASEYFKKQEHVNGWSLSLILSKLNTKDRMEFIKILLFHPKANHFSFTICPINIKIFINDYWQLLKVLQILPVDNRVSLLFYFDRNDLIKIVDSEDRLNSLLSLISPENIQDFFKIFTPELLNPSGSNNKFTFQIRK